jgi:putative FmdB family regulatory protein
MPIYGYRCSQCGHELEVLQSMSDPPLQVCGECGGPLRKLLYPVGVQFKGSGFYTTDYRGGGSSGNGSSSGGDADGSSGKPAGSDKADKADKPAASEKSEKKADSAAAKE